MKAYAIKNSLLFKVPEESAAVLALGLGGNMGKTLFTAPLLQCCRKPISKQAVAFTAPLQCDAAVLVGCNGEEKKVWRALLGEPPIALWASAGFQFGQGFQQNWFHNRLVKKLMQVAKYFEE